jgi:hypothetical protein
LIDGTPIGTVEDTSWTDVEEDHGVAWSEIVLNRPSDGVGAFVAEINGDRDFSV